MLIASSPVEIEAEADQAGLPPAARDAARVLFHRLTDRLGQAVATLSVAHHNWPTHRFYFGTRSDSLAPLLAGLEARSDIADVSGALPADPGRLAGLYCRDTEGGCEAVLVGHESHEGYLSPHRAA